MLISFVTDKPYQGDRIFDESDPTRAKYAKMKDEFARLGHQIHTSDILAPAEADAVIMHDLKSGFEASLSPSGENYALLVESSIIRPESYRRKNHRHFKKIFTWHDGLVCLNESYVKVCYGFSFPERIPTGLVDRQKLCALIISNKSSNARGELYSKRREVIRWFEGNHPSDFDLYGRGWNRLNLGASLLSSVLRRVRPVVYVLDLLFAEKYRSYRGEVLSKANVLSRYKFGIAFENVVNVPGYITEKIFDCLFSGCVPIYFGANNIKDYIPEECFIDFRRYESFDELYEYISALSDDAYLEYQRNILEFIYGGAADRFSARTFARTIVDEVVGV
ncbi:glycosyltransferase family 10 domain-containing protein [Thiohalomonas denitrificans]|uniref:Glycosyltransferase family 10 (Fucosyltransferase) C-term n=1 Tax=Thiohalomonas denitrificans TaxID=415747 RepID=A0A1G5R193_9GAMM|nr:glycosyltransferase family 10 [Thiohalomonas denitrificans]SCZ67241.1 Glycosyltransferase family 10 (fucosyltransferase) C-term [Thiohalomonas denitrificans]